MAFNERNTEEEVKKLASTVTGSSRMYRNPRKIYGSKTYDPHFSYDGEYLAVCDYTNGKVIVYRTKSFNIVAVISVTSPLAVTFDRDGDYLFIGRLGGNGIECYDTSDWTEVTLPAVFASTFSDGIRRLAVDRENNYLVAVEYSSTAGYLQAFDISDAAPASWTHSGTMEIGRLPEDLCFSHDNSYLAVGDHAETGGTAYIFNVGTWTKEASRRLTVAGEVLVDVRWSDDDKYLYFSTSVDALIYTYSNPAEVSHPIIRVDSDLQNEHYLACNDDLRSIWALDISHDGKYLLVANYPDREGIRDITAGVYIIKISTEELVEFLPGYSHRMNDAVFSIEDNYIAMTNYYDFTIWSKDDPTNPWTVGDSYTGTTTAAYTDALETDLRNVDRAVIQIENTDAAESMYFKVLTSGRYFDGIEIETVSETSLAAGDKANVQLDARWAKATVQVKDNSGNADYEVEWNGGV